MVHHYYQTFKIDSLEKQIRTSHLTEDRPKTMIYAIVMFLNMFWKLFDL